MLILGHIDGYDIPEIWARTISLHHFSSYEMMQENKSLSKF